MFILNAYTVCNLCQYISVITHLCFLSRKLQFLNTRRGQRIERICLLSFLFLKRERILKYNKKQHENNWQGLEISIETLLKELFWYVCIDCARHNAEAVDKVDEFGHGGEKAEHYSRGIWCRREHWRPW